MWLNKQITRSMFMEKVNNQTQELEKARQRNKELNEKYKHLSGEQKKLLDLVNSNQVDIVTGKNHLNALLDELKYKKRLNLTAVHRLNICNEQIESVQSSIDKINNLKEPSLTELVPIKEQLSFKWDVVECLQKMLLETRLQVAEKDSTISDLSQHVSDLENDIDVFKEKNTGVTQNVSQWQEEFLLARIREADVILEFDKLKRCIAFIKQELEDKKLETSQDHEENDGFQIHFSFKNHVHDRIKREEDNSITRTVEFQNEIDHLKMQIKRLADIKDDILKRIHFNEEIKTHLHEVRTSIFYRLQRTIDELNKTVQKYKQLEDKMKSELSQIQNKIDSKDVNISDLAQRINQMQLENENCVKSNNASLLTSNENTVKSLEDEIKYLEEEIDILHED